MPNKIINGENNLETENIKSSRATEATSQSSDNQSTIGGKHQTCLNLKEVYKGEGRGDCPQQLWKHTNYQQEMSMSVAICK